MEKNILNFCNFKGGVIMINKVINLMYWDKYRKL